MRMLKKGEVLQLERKGYYIVDEPYLVGVLPVCSACCASHSDCMLLVSYWCVGHYLQVTLCCSMVTGGHGLICAAWSRILDCRTLQPHRPDKPAVLFAIPDGRTKNMTK